MSIEIKSLETLSFDEIAEAFLKAFSDYNISFSREKLRDMLARRGYDPALSFGAFHNGCLVSFIFNGIGSYDGIRSGYDTGTGTVQAFRGLGLTDKIFTHSLPYLRESGIRQYVLEVLQSNAPAIKIYTRQGFEITRELNCYSGILKPESHLAGGIHIEDAGIDDIRDLTGFCDYRPTWQNSIESLTRVPQALTCVIAYMDDTPVGYGVAEPAYGDIAQIAVAPASRGIGIGSAILSRLSKSSRIPEIKVINTDIRDKALDRFLLTNGLSLTSTQYEMTRPI